ncbi:putative 2OG-Fe(II) oxygenase [Sphingomonas sediminicola]|uniref:putative 2OG-Fe(II) oxygenase n=1 Tax=Sphingomonas sediminicola TaxID=386874 RepID=UPI003CCCF831
MLVGGLLCPGRRGEGGQLVLHDPRMPALRMHAPGLRFKDAGPDVRTTIEPKSGLMVLFPAWLLHSVEPWQGDGHRISVAMNIRASMARR